MESTLLLPHIPAMAYVLDNLSTTNAAWIVKAVEAVIAETKNHVAGHPNSIVNSTWFIEEKQMAIEKGVTPCC